jgi:hypothetical protein
MNLNDKAKELVAFAKNNGLEIHSRTNPMEWAQTLAENDGQCPCKHAPVCPCEDALVRIKGLDRKPEDQMCGCTFYVSQAYLDHYERKAWKEGMAPVVPKTSQKEIRTTFVKTTKVDPELEQIALKKVDTYVNGIELLSKGNFNAFDELMQKEEQESVECGMCAADADIIRSEGNFVRSVCTHDDETCEAELEKLIDRTQRIIDENFVTAGYSKVTANLDGTPAKKNEWVEFAKKMLPSPELNGLPQKDKMKYVAAVYKGEYKTLTEAVQAMSEK